MGLPLIGLDASLFCEDCTQFALIESSTGGTETYMHDAEGTWYASDSSDHLLDDDDVRSIIDTKFGSSADALVCTLPNEAVEFRHTKRGVQISRAPLANRTIKKDDLGLDQFVDALGITGANRRAKVTQAMHFGNVVLKAIEKHKETRLKLLDLACGRSYLGFCLTQILLAKDYSITLRGVDKSAALIEKCDGIAAKLGLEDARFEASDLESFCATDQRHDIVLSLHGCDVLSDEAIRVGVECQAKYLFIAPCCQHELRHNWSEHALDWIGRYGILEQRLADTLTDGFRSLVLEALGYKVNVIRFTDPDVTPKNIIIQAVRSSKSNPSRLEQARTFMAEFKVRPRIAGLLGRMGFSSQR